MQINNRETRTVQYGAAQLYSQQEDQECKDHPQLPGEFEAGLMYLGPCLPTSGGKVRNRQRIETGKDYYVNNIDIIHVIYNFREEEGHHVH